MTELRTIDEADFWRAVYLAVMAHGWDDGGAESVKAADRAVLAMRERLEAGRAETCPHTTIYDSNPPVCALCGKEAP